MRALLNRVPVSRVENKRELVTDMMVKAKQIEYLINSLPPPEPEEVQVRSVTCRYNVTAETHTCGVGRTLGGPRGGDDESERGVCPGCQSRQ